MPLPVFVRDSDLPNVASTFPYLVDRSKATGSGHVAKLDFRTYDAHSKEMLVCGIPITPIVVEHGLPCEVRLLIDSLFAFAQELHRNA